MYACKALCELAVWSRWTIYYPYQHDHHHHYHHHHHEFNNLLSPDKTHTIDKLPMNTGSGRLGRNVERSEQHLKKQESM